MGIDRTFFESIRLDDVRGKFYRKAEVDSLLKEIEAKTELLNKDNELLTMKLETVKQNLSELGSAMDTAAAKANTIVSEANEEAEKIIGTTTAAAEQILTNAEEESEKKTAETEARCEEMLAEARTRTAETEAQCEEMLTQTKTKTEQLLLAAGEASDRMLGDAREQAMQLVAAAAAERERILQDVLSGREAFLQSVEKAWGDFCRTTAPEAAADVEPAEPVEAPAAEEPPEAEEEPEEYMLPEDLGDRIDEIARTLEELDSAGEE